MEGMHEESAAISRDIVTVAVEHSAQIGDLMTALAKAQTEMENPELDKENRFHKLYSSKAAVRNATIPILARHGIATTQHPCYLKAVGVVRCTTILWHGEQWLKSTLESPVVMPGQNIALEKLNHQDYTSVFTYISRIALKAVSGVCDESDEDGERKDDDRDEGRQGGNQGRVSAKGPGMRPESDRLVGQATQRRTEPNPLAQEEAQRQQQLAEIWDLYKEAIQPLKHAGMHKAIFFHCFHLDRPELIKDQSLETLVAGMALYRHLTAAVVTWTRESKPDDWIALQVRRLAGEPGDGEALPDGVDPRTGEDLRDMPDGWLTEQEQRQLQQRDEADLLDKTTA
jgi:hypothetical protein